MKRSIAVLFILAGMIGAVTSANAQPGKSVSVRIGQEKSAGRANIRIKFLEMIDDSRCPRDVECIQAGNASVRVRISRNGRSETMVLNTNKHGEKAVFSGYEFTLTGLTPEPRTNIRINRNGYVATIAVTKA